MGAVVGAVVGSADKSRQAGRAAGQAAQAREREARSQFDATEGRIDQAIQMADSPEEMAALQSSLQQQQTAVQKQADLFAALDPAVMEASNQALQLLKGEEAKALGPLRKNRERQKQKLMNRLREQLGPGAETSTAGIQAISQFDTQTDELLSGAQQQSLGQLFGMGSQGAQGRSALNQGIGVGANIGQAFGNIAARRSGAALSGAQALSGAGQGITQAAGSQFVGKQLQAQSQAQLFGNIAEAGISAGIGALGKQK